MERPSLVNVPLEDEGQSLISAGLPLPWPLEILSKDGRTLGLCFAHVDDVLVALDDSKSETRQHCDALKQQFQWISWEDADFTISGVHFRQDFVHNRWREIFLDQHDYARAIVSLQCHSSARDDQPLTPWEI